MNTDLPILGKTCSAIEVLDDTDIIFTCTDGSVYRMYHEQDCCECVSIEDICGDLDDLIGVPLVVAEVTANKFTEEEMEKLESEDKMDPDDDALWTFYRFAAKGHVTIRWFGTSNGYYGVGVEFEKVETT